MVNICIFRRLGQAQARQALGQDRQGDLQLQPCQRRAHADMQARAEAEMGLQVALPILFQRLPDLHLTEPPDYADVYHFHGLKRLIVSA